MNRVLYDHLGTEVNPGDIVKRELIVEGVVLETTFFYYGFSESRKGFLYLCNEEGELLDKNSRFNSPVDNGISLSNDDKFRWTKVAR